MSIFGITPYKSIQTSDSPWRTAIKWGYAIFPNTPKRFGMSILCTSDASTQCAGSTRGTVAEAPKSPTQDVSQQSSSVMDVMGYNEPQGAQVYSPSLSKSNNKSFTSGKRFLRLVTDSTNCTMANLCDAKKGKRELQVFKTMRQGLRQGLRHILRHVLRQFWGFWRFLRSLRCCRHLLLICGCRGKGCSGLEPWLSENPL